jgi:hypothetical protein
LLHEKGVEVRGYRTTKVKGSTIGFRGSNVKIEVAKKFKLLHSNVKVELANEHGFEVEGYNTTKLGSFKLGFWVLVLKSRPQ